MSAFDYSKWDKIELSDDEDDLHPNIDKDSWFRLKHRTRVERDEDEGKQVAEIEQKLKKVRDDLKVYGEANKEHVKAKKLQAEADALEAQLDKIEKEKKWNADNMCKTKENRSMVSSAAGPAPKPEPRLQGEAVAQGYVEFVEEHEDLLERYIAMGDSELEEVGQFLKEHGGTLLQGEHAESYLLLDCLEKEMNGEPREMHKSARQNQILTQLREFSRASQRPVRDAVHPIFQRLVDHEETRQAFDDAVADFIRRVEKRAVVKKKEMDAEMAGNEPGPGGLDPLEVLETLPVEMQEAFKSQDIARLHAAVAALPTEEAKYHMRRCEDSGLWVPSADSGRPPYRDHDSDD